MEEFESFQQLADRVSLQLRRDDDKKFLSEADWGIMRGSGYGLTGESISPIRRPAEYNGGWLVTLADDGPPCWVPE